MNEDQTQHLLAALDAGTRFDGRAFDEFRKIKIEKDVSANAEGSVRVTMGDTQVIAGVKLSLGTPYADSADEGTLMVNAEFTPLASKKFENGPPSIDSIELSRVVDRGIRESESIDVKKLCVEKGAKVWMVSVDIIPMNADGNLFDASGLAALLALKYAFFPAIKDGAVNYKEKTKNKLPLTKEPIPITVWKVGKHLLIDPTEEEENAASARLTLAIVDDENICAMQKGGETPLTVDEIEIMTNLAFEAAKKLRKLVK